MFQEAFEKLDLAATATILDQVNPAFGGTEFDPIETTIMALDMSFYPGYKLLDIADYSVMPAQRRYVLYNPKKSVVLDFTHAPIYALNKELPIQISEENIKDYVRFFFFFSRGRKSFFTIIENIDDIRWKDDPPPTARKAISKMIVPLMVKSIHKDGGFELEARMVFRDSLFKADIKVKKDGTVVVENEELLLESMPVMDETLGQ